MEPAARKADLPDIVIRSEDGSWVLIETEFEHFCSFIVDQQDSVTFREAKKTDSRIWECPTKESARAWRSVLAREKVREEGKQPHSWDRGWQEVFPDIRVCPTLESSLLVW